MEHELHLHRLDIVGYNNHTGEICLHNLSRQEEKIGGPGLTVELDKNLFAQRKSNIGRNIEQKWAFEGKMS